MKINSILAQRAPSLRMKSIALCAALLSVFGSLAAKEFDLPDFGLDIDHTHPNMPPLGYEGCADFRTPNLPMACVRDVRTPQASG